MVSVLGVIFLALLARSLVYHYLIPMLRVPAIDVDASDVILKKTKSPEDNYIYIPKKVKNSERVQCYEPATMKYLGFFPILKPEEVREHVKQAREAQKTWADSSFKQRRLLLRIMLKYILDHQELICQVSARDSGKTMVDAALGEILTTCEKINWLLKEGERWLKPEYRSAGTVLLHKSNRVEYHPLGVIGAIVPWNYPFHNIFNPMLAAIFSGNAIVIKVSEHATWSGCFYLRIIHSALIAAGASPDLVHIVTGFAETGEALVTSVDKVIFVGSTGVGRKVMEAASRTLTPVVLELGGKDAFIVCDDADVTEVAPIAVRGALQSSGQNCAGAERFYVQEPVYEKFVKEVSSIVKSVRMGLPLERQSDMGAICMSEHVEKLRSLVDEALEDGAECAVCGIHSMGKNGEELVGQFFPPTVLINVNHSMRIMQEEVFGPIISIMKFQTDQEAVDLANDCNFGLGCAVFSKDKRRANAIASKIYCGMATINDFATTYMSQALPFGGVKHSGFDRFAGIEGLRGCCLVKAVTEDRWPFIRTVIPKLLQYPVADNAFEFQGALIRMFYGLDVWTKIDGLREVLKALSAANKKTPVQK